MANVHVGDIGTELEILFEDQDGAAINISGATTKEIILVTPRGDQLTRAGTFTTNGTDGLLKYTTIKNDIIVAGEWKISGHIVNASGEWTTDVKTFDVLPQAKGRRSCR